jgi:hypothetical protein
MRKAASLEDQIVVLTTFSPLCKLPQARLLLWIGQIVGPTTLSPLSAIMRKAASLEDQIVVLTTFSPLCKLPQARLPLWILNIVVKF